MLNEAEQQYQIAGGTFKITTVFFELAQLTTHIKTYSCLWKKCISVLVQLAALRSQLETQLFWTALSTGVRDRSIEDT